MRIFMQITSLTESYYKNRYLAFKWRHNAVVTNKIALAFGMAVLTGLLAQARFYLPGTPVPITGQTFAVLMAGVLLGRYWGGISMSLYTILGVAGVPWFAGWSGGLAVLAGPTGGYIFGFIFAALFLGYVTDKYVGARKFLPMLGLMLFANFILIHVPGLIQLGIWTSIIKGSSVSLSELLMMGSVPFMLGGIIKIAAASAVTKAITPKREYRK
jgi:biotin transport system substrate-specific component